MNGGSLQRLIWTVLGEKKKKGKKWHDCSFNGTAIVNYWSPSQNKKGKEHSHIVVWPFPPRSSVSSRSRWKLSLEVHKSGEYSWQVHRKAKSSCLSHLLWLNAFFVLFLIWGHLFGNQVEWLGKRREMLSEFFGCSGIGARKMCDVSHSTDAVLGMESIATWQCPLDPVMSFWKSWGGNRHTRISTIPRLPEPA